MSKFINNLAYEASAGSGKRFMLVVSTLEELEARGELDKNMGNLSEDYKLGHSYFMNIENAEDLAFVKEYKIKPLLEEYFYSEERSADEILKEVESLREENND